MEAVAQAATYNKRGRSGCEGGISFYLCVCDVYSPWSNDVSCRTMQIVKAYTTGFSDSIGKDLSAVCVSSSRVYLSCMPWPTSSQYLLASRQ